MKALACYWLEDKPENAECGYRYGLNPLLIEHGHNMHTIMKVLLG
jgi:hypothetical protein